MPPRALSFIRSARSGEAELLASCYRNSLAIAAGRSLRTIGFPSISTGAYGYPVEEAAKIAVETVREVLSGSTSAMEVTFCCFSAADLEIYQAIVAS